MIYAQKGSDCLLFKHGFVVTSSCPGTNRSCLILQLDWEWHAHVQSRICPKCMNNPENSCKWSTYHIFSNTKLVIYFKTLAWKLSVNVIRRHIYIWQRHAYPDTHIDDATLVCVPRHAPMPKLTTLCKPRYPEWQRHAYADTQADVMYAPIRRLTPCARRHPAWPRHAHPNSIRSWHNRFVHGTVHKIAIRLTLLTSL